MSYQEREITKDKLQNYLKALDSDEGIRIDNKDARIFINKITNRYIINISKNGLDQFFYQNNLEEALHFLDDKIDPSSKIFLY